MVTHSRCTQCGRQDHGGDIYEVLQVGRRSSGVVLYVWCLSALVPHHICSCSVFQEMCGLIDIDDPECPKAGKHHELEAAEIKKSEEAVQRTLTAIKTFTAPFAITDNAMTVSTISHLLLLFLQRSKLISLELTQLVRKPRRLSSVIASRIGHPKKASLNPSRDRSLNHNGGL